MDVYKMFKKNSQFYVHCVCMRPDDLLCDFILYVLNVLGTSCDVHCDNEKLKK